MKQEVIDQELAAAQDLLATTAAAHLAYVGPDASARVVPVAVYWTGHQFVVSTAATAPKVAALQERPDVALSVDSGNTPGTARALSVRGTATVEIVDGIVPEFLAAASQSMDEQAAAEFEINVRAMYDRMARIAITPQWARFYDFNAGRIPKFLAELAEKAQGANH